jgi:hypothetical protein
MKLAALREWVKGPRSFVTMALVLTTEEVDLKVVLDAVVAAHPAVTIGSYPALFDPRFRTRITFDATSPDVAQAALDDLRARVDAATIVAVE